MPLSVTDTINTIADETQQPRTASVLGADTIARQRLAMWMATGRDLLQAKCWIQLKKAYTFNTVANTASYVLPNDFYSGMFLGSYNTATRLPLLGPISDEFANYEIYGLGGDSLGRTQYRIFGLPGTAQFQVYPTPTGIAPITFYYISKNWVNDSGSYTDANPVTVNATSVFDDELMLLGTKWRLLQALGQDYGEFKNDYLNKIDAAKNRFLGPQRGSFCTNNEFWSDFNQRFRPATSGNWNI